MAVEPPKFNSIKMHLLVLHNYAPSFNLSPSQVNFEPLQIVKYGSIEQPPSKFCKLKYSMPPILKTIQVASNWAILCILIWWVNSWLPFLKENI